jgi:hypothetical protein
LTAHISTRQQRARDNRRAVFVPAFYIALVAAHIFDLVSFIVMTARHGLEAEANPIVVLVAEQVGLPGLTIAKLASVVIGGSVFVLLARGQRRKLAMGVVLFGVAAGLTGGFVNLATIYAY